MKYRVPVDYLAVARAEDGRVIDAIVKYGTNPEEVEYILLQKMEREYPDVTLFISSQPVSFEDYWLILQAGDSQPFIEGPFPDEEKAKEFTEEYRNRGFDRCFVYRKINGVPFCPKDVSYLLIQEECCEYL